MTKQAIENSVVTLASMTTGAMLSRVVANKLPIDNTKIRRGAVILAGILGASYLDRSSTGKAIVQDMAMASAVTQTGYLVKDFLGDTLKDNKLLYPALGSPMDDFLDEPFELDSTDFLSSYLEPNYDFISEETDFEVIEEFEN